MPVVLTMAMPSVDTTADATPVRRSCASDAARRPRPNAIPRLAGLPWPRCRAELWVGGCDNPDSRSCWSTRLLSQHYATGGGVP